MLQPRGYQTVSLQLPLSCIAASGHHLSRTAGSRNIQTNLPGLSLPCPFQSIHPCSMPSLSTFCFLGRNDFAATPYLELKTMQSKTKQQQPKKKRTEVLLFQLRSLDQALALHLLDHLVLYIFFCLAPIFLGTSLQASELPSSSSH